ncbi:MAG TPA: ParB/RepB/Spo0J family partition protein, partial [Candidatus Nitrosopolaris sp.]|nr:ParB/RepB/Spo0J family partition protein [Candidatus Nitrosopolaris sp.]
SFARDNAVRELATSINQHGLFHPIIVRPVDRGFEIVAGNRRFEACRFLRWKYVPVKVRELSEKDAFEIQLTENIQRMTLSAIDEARAFKKYTTEFGWGGESELARRISRSEQYVSNRIQLLRLPKEIIDEIAQNRLKVSHAAELVNLDEHEQKIINDAIIGEKLTVRDVREIRKQASPKRRQKVKSELAELESSQSFYAHTMTERPTKATTSTNDTIKQRIKLLQKAQVCLRVSLYRLDTLIHESDEKLSREEHSEVNELLMQFRLKVHSMMDDSIKAIAKLNKKLL